MNKTVAILGTIIVFFTSGCGGGSSNGSASSSSAGSSSSANSSVASSSSSSMSSASSSSSSTSNSSSSSVSKPYPTPSATAIGVPVGVANTATIDSTGGSLVSPDGRATLTIPAGVVTVPTTFSIRPISNFAYGSIGKGYRLEPEGLTFSRSATLTFNYTEDDLVGSADTVLGAASQSADGLWHWSSGTVDQAGHTVSIPVTHFSDWSLVTSFVLAPSVVTAPADGTRTVTGQYCYGPSSISNGAAFVLQVGYNCKLSTDELSKFSAIGGLTDWSVSAGTIAEVNPSGIITVDTTGTDPAQNPVVSVKVDYWDEIEGVLKKYIKTPATDPPKRANWPTALSGSIDFNINSNHALGGGRTRYGNVNATLVRDPTDILSFTGHAMTNIRVDYNLSGMVCDSLSVPVDMTVEMKFADFGAPETLLGATGTYSAQTRCCADGFCQQQDVSDAVLIETACMGGDFIRSADLAVVDGHARFICSGPDYSDESDVTWLFSDPAQPKL